MYQKSIIVTHIIRPALLQSGCHLSSRPISSRQQTHIFSSGDMGLLEKMRFLRRKIQFLRKPANGSKKAVAVVDFILFLHHYGQQPLFICSAFLYAFVDYRETL